MEAEFNTSISRSFDDGVSETGNKGIFLEHLSEFFGDIRHLTEFPDSWSIKPSHYLPTPEGWLSQTFGIVNETFQIEIFQISFYGHKALILSGTSGVQPDRAELSKYNILPLSFCSRPERGR